MNTTIAALLVLTGVVLMGTPGLRYSIAPSAPTRFDRFATWAGVVLCAWGFMGVLL